MTKPYEISRHLVWKAYQQVKANKGAAGIDRETIQEFEKDLKDKSFFETLKSEWIYGRRIRSKEELQKLLFEYIHDFYNRKRMHSTLGYLSPAEYLRHYYQSRSLAS